jgi:hypothetical protein
MRRIVRVVFFSFLLLFSFNTQAQFNINSLFAPLDIGVAIFQDQPASAHKSILINSFEDHMSGYFDTLNGWKHWSIVENYAYGKDRGDLPMITDLNSLHPFFRDQVVKLIEKCKAKGIELAIVETYRTPAKQHEYKRMGKKYTNSGAGQSKHQYGLAVDLVPIVKGVAVWDNALLWRKIGVAGEKLGLRWGGRWRNPYDPGHFEWTGGLASYHLKAGKLPKLPVAGERYPCLEEDIEILRKYWKEWETSQSAMTRK